VAAEPGERDALIPDSPIWAAGWSQVGDKGVTASVESVAVEPDTPGRIEARGRELETASVPEGPGEAPMAKVRFERTITP
jgi:hypothetical protein